MERERGEREGERVSRQFLRGALLLEAAVRGGNIFFHWLKSTAGKTSSGRSTTSTLFVVVVVDAAVARWRTDRLCRPRERRKKSSRLSTGNQGCARKTSFEQPHLTDTGTMFNNAALNTYH